MCGISGFIDPSISSVGQQRDLIGKMLKSIEYRGPDNSSYHQEGAIVIGQNRLSIIDLTESANQPFLYKETILTYNGEIYNYIEIRDELKGLGYQFRTDSDTEVISVAYDAWGRDCVKKFVGMWAFALYDKRTKELFCCRDRFGIKPFYYIHDNDSFYFASEYKPLKFSRLYKGAYNEEQINRGLQLGWISYKNESYFKEINQLPQASSLVFSEGKIAVEKYWELKDIKKVEGTERELIAKFKDLFLDSIRIHMRSDVSVGACLSGGIDSSAIASCVGKLFPEVPFNTYTIFFDGENEVDERPFAKLVNDKYSNLKPYYYQPKGDKLMADFEKIMHHQEVPIAGSSPISQYFVMELAAKHNAKVLLDGQGADEYLAGYMHSFYRLIGGSIAKLNLKKGVNQFSDYVKWQEFSTTNKVSRFLKSVLAGFWSEQKLYAFEYKNFYSFLPKNNKVPFSLNGNTVGRLDQFLYHQLFSASIPNLLHYEDRNSMAFSIESRVPFLDHRLVEFVFALPDEYKIKDGTTKYILRESMDNILPDAIKDRKDKKGFVTPGEVKWLRGPLKALLEFDGSHLPMLDKKKVNQTLARYKKGDNSESILVWRLAMLNYWLSKN